MCGIAGIFAWSSQAPNVDPGELRAVRDHMAVRGPDGSGEWFSPDGRVALGHRRLAIIDLSELGAQPMHFYDDRYSITYNGEIYNYEELRQGLEAAGVEFRSGSDTEVLLALFARKGERMLDELRGMYAFAIWDDVSKRLFLARDPFGIKPLYYSSQAGAFRFASQVKALLQAPADRSASAAGHAGFLLWGSVPEPWTLYEGIRALPAGHCLVVGAAGPEAPLPFCRIADILEQASGDPATGTRTQALEAIAAAIHDSVIAHQVADVPVGVFLSAGLDSCVLASSATEHGDGHPYTLTLGFREFVGSSDDEVPVAEEIARKLGSWHSTLMTSRENFESEHERLILGMDQPSIDGVNTWFVARAASQMQLKVALSGLGGDELFASYPSFNDVPKLARTVRPFAGAEWMGRALRRASAPVIGKLTSPKYAGLLEYGGTRSGAYLLRRCLFGPWELPGLLGAEMAAKGLSELQTLPCLDASSARIGNDRLAVTALEMQWYMRSQLLRDADWAGMAQSLEIRVPYLDLPLLKAAAPWFARYPDIRKAEVAAVAAPRLPESLLRRPKTGFSVPVREWIGTPGTAKRERGLRGWAQYVHGRFWSPPW